MIFSETLCFTHQYLDQQNTVIENYTEGEKEEIASNSGLVTVGNTN